MKKYQPITLWSLKNNILDNPNADLYTTDGLVESFVKLFGNGEIPLDDKSAAKLAGEFSWWRIAIRFLDKEDHKKWEKMVKPIKDKRHEIATIAREQNKKDLEKIEEDYEKAKKEANDRFYKSLEPIDNEYDKSHAVEFVRLYRKGMGK